MMTIEPPEEYHFWNVMYWEPYSKSLVKKKEDGSTEAATLLNKAETFLEANCIEETGESGGNKRWICKPLKGYNKTTYTILFNASQNRFCCDCQGYNSKLKKGDDPNCSHVLATRQFAFMERGKDGQRR